MFDPIGLVLLLAQKFPVILTILVFIGGLRLIFKPLFAFLNSIAAFSTWTDRDDKIVAGIEQSKVMKVIFFILDWAASIKIPGRS